MQIHFTSDYHPEGDGQTEHINQTLEQYLHVYCNYQQDISMNYRVLSKLKSPQPNSVIKNLLMCNVLSLLISK